MAAIAAVANVGSYAGLSMRGRYSALGWLHVAVLLLGLATVGRIGLQYLLAIRAFGRPVRATPAPRGVAVLVVCALGYLVAIFAFLIITYGEGGPQLRDGQEVWVLNNRVKEILPAGSIAVFATRELRLFSASWLFFALFLAWASHAVESRIRAYREMRREAAA